MKTGNNLTKMVPPDGGWGWLVVLGSSIINISTMSIETSFGLIFGDLFKLLGIETTGASIVVSLQMLMFNLSGILVGPLTKKYTYRKIAILGSLISAGSIIFTAPANSILHIIITFGLIGGIGFGLAYSSTLVGINDYFREKKGQAVGLSLAGTVIGFMIMPHIIRFLLDEYEFRAALLILGAISLHAVVGACFFQPVSWHMKPVSKDLKEEASHTLLPTDEINNKDWSKSMATTNRVKLNMRNPEAENENKLLKIKSQALSKKEPLISSVPVLGDDGGRSQVQESTKEGSQNESKTINSDVEEGRIKNSNLIKSGLSRFYKFMDLDLLADGVYWNISFGLSTLFVVEMNFKLILPFFLLDLGFTPYDVVSVLSSMTVSDIIARIIVPPILDRIAITRRVSFLFSILAVAIGRSCLTLFTTIGPIITTLLIVGFFRGISFTSYPLVLAEYSSGKHFPSVLGLCMVFRGILSAVVGPLSGYLRDVTNSYPLFIHFQTVLVTLISISWIVEMIFKSKKNKQDIMDNLLIETKENIIIVKSSRAS